MKRTLILISAFGLLLLHPILAAGAELELRGHLDCTAAQVNLGDLVSRGSADDYADRLVAQAPAPGASSTLSRHRLARQLADWGWRGHLTGPEEITLSTQGVVLDTSRLRQAVEARLADDLEELGLRLVEVSEGWTEELLLADSRVRWTLELPNRIEQRMNLSRLTITDAAGFERRLRLRFHCSRPQQVAVAGKRLLRGAPVSGWRFEERDDFDIQGTPLSPAELAGAVVQQPIEAGATITRSNTRPAPLVRSGREVQVSLQRGAVTVSLRGIARSDGALGDLVSVRHIGDRSLRRYRVAGPGLVVPSYIQAQGDDS
jgi:flagellar basal body P-ring formation protein FlgA